jgi:alcohol dehydrogenase
MYKWHVVDVNGVNEENKYFEKQQGIWISLPGSHAEYMLAYTDATILLPDAITYEQAAPIFCSGYAVYSGLRTANPKPHEHIAVVGTGGLGHLCIQYS